jgi:hypothetical protein
MRKIVGTKRCIITFYSCYRAPISPSKKRFKNMLRLQSLMETFFKISKLKAVESKFENQGTIPRVKKAILYLFCINSFLLYVNFRQYFWQGFTQNTFSVLPGGQRKNVSVKSKNHKFIFVCNSTSSTTYQKKSGQGA